MPASVSVTEIINTVLGSSVAETVTVNTLGNSSSESRPVNVRSNMPAITNRDSEIDVDKGSSDSDIDENVCQARCQRMF